MNDSDSPIFTPKDDFENKSLSLEPQPGSTVVWGVIVASLALGALATALFNYFGSFKNMCCALGSGSGGGGGGGNCGDPRTSCPEGDYTGGPDCGEDNCSYCGPLYHPPPNPWP